MKITVYFDMDGTIADLYGVPEWLPLLRAENPIPYRVARPMVNMSRLARALHKVQRNGYAIGVISWGSKNASTEYDEMVEQAKREWLARHLPSVQFDEIKVVHYGVPKSTLANDGDLLFDDDERNLTEWGDNAYAPDEIFSVLASL